MQLEDRPLSPARFSVVSASRAGRRSLRENLVTLRGKAGGRAKAKKEVCIEARRMLPDPNLITK